MTKKREELDMATIIDSAVKSYLEDSVLTGAPPFGKFGPAEKERLRQAFPPVIWSAWPAIIEQFAAVPVIAVETEKDILAELTVPNSLEGLIQ